MATSKQPPLEANYRSDGKSQGIMSMATKSLFANRDGIALLQQLWQRQLHDLAWVLCSEVSAAGGGSRQRATVDADAAAALPGKSSSLGAGRFRSLLARGGGPPAGRSIGVDGSRVDAPACRTEGQQDEHQNGHENLHVQSVPIVNLRCNMSFPNKISACRIIGEALSSSI